MRIALAVSAIAVVAIVTQQVEAQSPPDFSGRWTFTSSIPAGTSALGDDVTITQTALTLTIDATGYNYSASTNGASSRTAVPLQLIYTLDGAEHPRQLSYPRPAPARPPFRGSPMSLWTAATLEDSFCKATWAGSDLVIMTYSAYRLTAPTLTPGEATMRQTVRQALSLDSDGRLVVDSLILADPLPWGRTSTKAPVPVRSLYTRN